MHDHWFMFDSTATLAILKNINKPKQGAPCGVCASLDGPVHLSGAVHACVLHAPEKILPPAQARSQWCVCHVQELERRRGGGGGGGGGYIYVFILEKISFWFCDFRLTPSPLDAIFFFFRIPQKTKKK
jgi:hypothetical protein